MSHDFSGNSVHYSVIDRRPLGVRWLGPLALAVALLSGCASGGSNNAVSPAVSTQETAPLAADSDLKNGKDRANLVKHAKLAKATKSIDQSPIAVTPTSTDIATNPQFPITDADKESDMTVLVLDNPELMAKAAQISAINSQVNTKDESPRKPHRLTFHFDFNKHRMSDEDRAILSEHAAYLKAHPDVTVQINGHTDNHGADEYNDFLSRLRAKTAAKVFEQAGVDHTQIDIKGWGSRKPLTNQQDHAANRRLELEYRSEQMAKAQ
jgi:peptidoglycan-associated lipoprotein